MWRQSPHNYKGCDYYQKQYQAKYNNTPNATQNYTSKLNQQQSAIPRTQNKTYAQAIRGKRPPNAVTNEEELMSLPNFLGEFKAMFNQLIQQNDMVLNKLTLLIIIMVKFLRIALWNVNGLAQHTDEIQLFLQQNKINISLISETHFTMKSYFKTPHYNMYYTNHPGAQL
jgi:hypothetical protein